MVVYLCSFRGIKMSGIIAVYSAAAPFLLLIILIVRGLFLPGSVEGLLYLINANGDWSRLFTM